MDPCNFDLPSAPGHVIRRLQQRHQCLWADFVGSRLTSVQFAVLASVHSSPEADQRTLATALSIDTSTLAEVCRRLAARKLLERSRTPEDSRRYVLRLTPEGESLLWQIIPAVEDVGTQVLGPLAPSERTTVLTLLRRVLDAGCGRGPQP
jgi:DNA-binding MarR family transcriptional regulator